MTGEPVDGTMRQPPHPTAPPPTYSAAPPTYGAPGAYPPGPRPYREQRPPVDPNTPTNTIWIWLAIILPFVGVASLFLFDWHGYIDAVVAQTEAAIESQGARPEAEGFVRQILALMPHLALISVLAFACSGLSILFYGLDYMELGRRGVHKRFHWAWSLLGLVTVGGLLPVIGRTVVLRMQDLRAFLPLTVFLILTVLSGAATAWLGYSVFSELALRLAGLLPGS